MKIFVDCHVFDHGFQGTRTYIQGLYLEMIKNKDIDFYFASSNMTNLESVFGSAENIFYLQYKSKNKFYRLLFDCPRLIKENKIDFAHFQYIVPLFKSCKFIVSTHDVLFLDYPEYFPRVEVIKNKILFKYSAKKSEIVVTGSLHSKERIEHHFKIKNVFYKVYGVESVFFENYNKTIIKNVIYEKYGLKNYIIYISRHEPRKNHFRLLQSFLDLKLYENYSLVLVGNVSIKDPNFENLYLNLENHISTKVILLNNVDFKDLLFLLRGADLSVYPSIAEGFGLPPLESVAARIPTLCSNTTSMSEFKFFENDFINPLNQNDINIKIFKKLAECDIEKLTILSDSVANNYNWKIAAKSFFDILKNKYQIH